MGASGSKAHNSDKYTSEKTTTPASVNVEIEQISNVAIYAVTRTLCNELQAQKNKTEALKIARDYWNTDKKPETVKERKINILHACCMMKNDDISEHIITDIFHNIAANEKIQLLLGVDKYGNNIIQQSLSQNTSAKIIELILKDIPQEERINLLKAQNINGNNSLHVACCSHPDAIRLLLKDIEPEEMLSMMLHTNKKKCNAIYEAMMSSSKQKIISTLLELSHTSFDDKKQLFQPQGSEGYTPLHIAAQHYEMQYIVESLKGCISKEKVELLGYQDKEGYNVLHWLLINYRPEKTKLEDIKSIFNEFEEEDLKNLLLAKDSKEKNVFCCILFYVHKNQFPEYLSYIKELIIVLFKDSSPEEKQALLEFKYNDNNGETLLPHIFAIYHDIELIKELLPKITQEEIDKLIVDEICSMATSKWEPDFVCIKELIQLLIKESSIEKSQELLTHIRANGKSASQIVLSAVAKECHAEAIADLFPWMKQEEIPKKSPEIEKQKIDPKIETKIDPPLSGANPEKKDFSTKKEPQKQAYSSTKIMQPPQQLKRAPISKTQKHIIYGATMLGIIICAAGILMYINLDSYQNQKVSIAVGAIGACMIIASLTYTLFAKIDSMVQNSKIEPLNQNTKVQQ